MGDPIIRVRDIAWIRLRSPDVDLQERYLTDFGLVRSARTPHALYMRGTDPNHHIHITEQGDPAVLGIAFWATCEEDLHTISRHADGTSGVEALDEPGGGQRVRLREHNGMGIEIVWGVETLAALPVQVNTLNFGHAKTARAGDLLRVEPRPSQVKRIGHAVLSTPDIDRSAAWAHHHLGIIRSDDVHAEDDPDKLLASFNRIDAGEDYVDHHVMMFGLHQRGGLNHVSFEVQDLDDVFMGHQHLRDTSKYEHMWGIGRHLLGSQVYDYWADPWRRVHEHWADSDRLNIKNGSNLLSAEEALVSQWGDPPPQKFIEHVSA
jgi:hypothetical protein